MASRNFWSAALSAALICMVAPASSYAQAAGVLPAETCKALDELVAKGVEEKIYPGAVLYVGSPGKKPFACVHGRLTHDTTSPQMCIDTIFDLASVSKCAGTATAAMLLLDSGKISVEDPVAKHIAAFAKASDTITLRDLMTHVSGLPAYTSPEKVEEQRRLGESHADALVRCYASLKRIGEPRTKYVYSCLNMQTMARVNENVAGESQEALLKRSIFDPLGMKDTAYNLSEEQKKRCAPTMVKPDGTPLVGEVHDPLASYHGSKRHCPGNAGLFSTAPDLARLCELWLNEGEWQGKRIVKSQTVRMMTDRQTPKNIKESRALGWDIYTTAPYCTKLNAHAGARVIGHTGYTGTMIWMDQKTKTYAILLTNRTYPDEPASGKRITDVRRQMADLILRALPEYRGCYD